MRLSRQFQACLCFLRKDFARTKSIKMQNVFHPLRNFCVKSCCRCCFLFACFCFVSWGLLVRWFCGRENFSQKKINRLEIGLITSFCVKLQLLPSISRRIRYLWPLNDPSMSQNGSNFENGETWLSSLSLS